jgi:hypothetical protein
MRNVTTSSSSQTSSGEPSSNDKEKVAITLLMTSPFRRHKRMRQERQSNQTRLKALMLKLKMRVINYVHICEQCMVASILTRTKYV